MIILDNAVVAFDVRLKTHKRNLATKALVVFETVDLNEGLMTSYRIKFDVAIIHANASIHDTKHLQVHLFVRDLWIQREGTILSLCDSLPRLSLP